MENAQNGSGGRSRYVKDWLGVQALIFGVALLLAWLQPTFQALFCYAAIGLIKQLLPGAIQMVSAPPLAPGEVRDTLLVPIDWRFLSEILGLAIVIDLLLLNPLVYVFRRFILPFRLQVGDDQAVIRKLRVRAMTLRCAATGSLLLIICLLVIGLLIFIAAERLTGYEVMQPPTAADASKSKEVKVAAGGEKGESLYFMISTVTTRISAALMLIFLVKILTSLYRYNVRLAAFSDSRADALEAMASFGGKSPANLRKIVLTLAADRVPFIETSTPVGEVAAAFAPVVKKMTEVVEKGAGKVAEKKSVPLMEGKP